MTPFAIGATIGAAAMLCLSAAAWVAWCLVAATERCTRPGCAVCRRAGE